VMLLTGPESGERLDTFYRRARPGGPGWRVVQERTGVPAASPLGRDLLESAAVLAYIVGAMLGIGGVVVGSTAWAAGGAAATAAGLLARRRFVRTRGLGAVER